MNASPSTPAAPLNPCRGTPLEAERGREILLKISGQQQAWAQKKKTIQKERGACPRCYLGTQGSGVCICDIIRPLACPHAVTCLVHAPELYKVSSTHQILIRGLQHSQLCVWKSPEFPEASDVWRDVLRQCEVSGKTPCVLYPSKDAIPAGQFFASLSPEQRKRGLHVVVLDGTWSGVQAMNSELPDASIAPRVIITPPATYTLFGPLRAPPSPGRVSTLEAVACLFDELRDALRADERKEEGKELGEVSGGEGSTRSAPSDKLAPGSLRVTIKRTLQKADASLVAAEVVLAHNDHAKAAQRQFMKTAGEVKTTLDPVASASASTTTAAPAPAPAAGSDASSSSTPPLTAATASNASKSNGSSKETFAFEMIVAPPTPNGSDFWGSQLRRFLQVHVDATLKQTNKLHAWSHGVGYRTWFLTLPPNLKAIGGKEEGVEEGDDDAAAGEGEGEEEDSGPKRPTEVVPLAGPFFSALPCHLITAIARYAYGEERVLRDGYAVSFERSVSEWGKVENPTKNLGCPPAKGRWPPPKATRTVEVAGAVTAEAPSPAEGAATAAAAAPTAAAVTVIKVLRRLDPIERQFCRPLPDANPPFTATPLALTCRALYVLASGYCLGSWWSYKISDGSVGAGKR